MDITPKRIVLELNKKIIGQNKAKKAVAIALRNRLCRQKVKEPLRSEIIPKNILMIGPTGVGKTEIARRIAKLTNSPFIKVEATKFTEVGYVGKDVESIIKDLLDIAIKQVREFEISKVIKKARNLAENKILDILIPINKNYKNKSNNKNYNSFIKEIKKIENKNLNSLKDINYTRKIFLERLRKGLLDEKKIELEFIDISNQMEIITPPGMEEITEQIRSMFSGFSGSNKKKRKLKIKEALKLLIDEESSKLVNLDELKMKAILNVEQNGIVFLDEIDKIATKHNFGNDVSRSGVQRDLLSLVEGTTVYTKYGIVKTDYVLFIASGAFHLSKPSDLIPELQGRFPIVVKLDSLSIDDFFKILTNTESCLIEQYIAILKIDKIKVNFSENGVKKLAEIAYKINENTENIGARRLFTVMEKILENISFLSRNIIKKSIVIDDIYVNKHLKNLIVHDDLFKYII